MLSSPRTPLRDGLPIFAKERNERLERRVRIVRCLLAELNSMRPRSAGSAHAASRLLDSTSIRSPSIERNVTVPVAVSFTTWPRTVPVGVEAITYRDSARAFATLRDFPISMAFTGFAVPRR